MLKRIVNEYLLIIEHVPEVGSEVDSYTVVMVAADGGVVVMYAEYVIDFAVVVVVVAEVVVDCAMALLVVLKLLPMVQ